ncbi:MAG: Phosphate:acyl-ACP acyltransferase PlsX [uncultured Thiotrichaceae bacterium]|uniref:Phosphate acyltransferase n=1 Tax=uncultured Thiotrichaceae bacterium TaxID=298394 RepID=A0A6S6T8E5_9GAMM|nr:MAG: Phosphate:acyl-ACP acyltransferase PlsX [uncultured Thiotrichaceae bacterium]
MDSLIRISLDAMGGDHGLSVVVPAALKSLKEHEDIALTLVGDEAKILEELASQKAGVSERLHIQHASQKVEMDEAPASALRNKKDSSMRVAINLVKSGQVDAAVSAGNTGALMSTARFVLKMLPGVDRPAICTVVPTSVGHTHILDLGANVDCTADHLYQFAIMGSVLAQAVDGGGAPKVGLLNVGQEAIKGNEQVKATDALLRETPLNYIGYIEGDDIFHGDVDVVVCDGFVGNVALKTMEGLAKMLTQELKSEYTKGIFSKIAALISLPVLKAFRRRFDPRRYNGASFLGLQGIVVKSHGGMDAFGFSHAIAIARSEVIKKVPQTIHQELETLFAKQEH